MSITPSLPPLREIGGASSFLKAAWAEQHLDALKPLVSGYEESEPVLVKSNFKPHRPGYDMTFHVIKAPPVEFALIAGDVIGCLRDALDHLVYELTVSYSGIPDRSFRRSEEHTSE